MKASDLPKGNTVPALEFSHFPTRHQAVVWRNWNLVPAETLARVLACSVDEVRRCAAELGLEEHPETLARWKERGFQTVIRRNWDLLDYEQLLDLLGWTPEQLAFTLKEDDFLFYKLGLLKPQCEKVRFCTLTAAEAERTRKICATVRAALAQAPRTEAPFAFLDTYGRREVLPRQRNDFGLRMIYSYSALYGDPLMNDEIDSYPEGLLKDYAASGVNAVWLQGTLYTLVPWLGENLAISCDWQKRQRNLRRLVERAAKYGLKVIVYLNEPRSMPKEFFADRPGWCGSPDESGDYFALCTSNPEVQEALKAGVRRLFESVSGLGGIFTITMSENLTHCKSRGGSCPRCADRSPEELAAEVNNLIAEAMHSVDPEAKMIAYNWAWADPGAVISRLRPDVTVMAVSETKVVTDCLGYKGEVHDYSVSKPGPGEQAKKVWRIARDHGTPAVAKVQFNCSWELCAVPYLPVPDLIEEHIANLKAAGVCDLMLSWTLGGYPGGNLELLAMDKRSLAERRFGKSAEQVLAAWSCFSRAFHDYFPFNNTATLYFAPQNFGPMNLLYAVPTGRDASMIGFPFDDIETWRGAKGNAAAEPLDDPIPPEVLEKGFGLLSEKWQEGIAHLEKVAECDRNEAWRDLHRIALACYLHFRSAYWQIVWVRKRKDPAIAREERKIALEMLQLMRQDSRLGYEASNHYLYTENDLLEKIINCETFLD